MATAELKTNNVATTTFKIDSQVMRNAFRRASHCRDAESSRYALGGGLLRIANGVGRITTTDGCRLVTEQFSAPADVKIDVVINGSDYNEITSIGKTAGPITATIHNGQIWDRLEFNWSQRNRTGHIAIDHIDQGRFPSCDQYCMDESEYDRQFDNYVLTLERHSLSFDPDRVKLRIDRSGPYLVANRINWSVVAQRGIPREVSFNLSYLRNWLDSQTDKHVRIYITDSESPIMAYASNSIFCFMPMSAE